jgi:hypothetical protein
MIGSWDTIHYPQPQANWLGSLGSESTRRLLGRLVDYILCNPIIETAEFECMALVIQTCWHVKKVSLFWGTATITSF